MPTDVETTKGTGEKMSAVLDKKILNFRSQQWKLVVGGKEYIIREQIGRIVKMIEVVKDFGSKVAGLDPIHAGLPWAGVCVLLTARKLSNYSRRRLLILSSTDPDQ